jgi:hypothetical protein
MKLLWDLDQVRAFVMSVRQETRNAWEWMTPRVREALVAERCFAVVRGQARQDVATEQMDALLLAMRVRAGLETDPDVIARSPYPDSAPL